MPSSPKLATDPAGQLHILGHDCDPLSVDCTQVGVLKQSNKVGLACLLQSLYRRGLETNRGEEGHCDLPHQPLEWQLPDQKLSGLLVTFNLSQSHRPRSESNKFESLVSSKNSIRIPMALLLDSLLNLNSGLKICTIPFFTCVVF